jgi:hypothetical protein
MSTLRNLVLLLGAVVACSDSTSVKNFTYGGGQPGEKLAEGGEVRHEHVALLGMPAQTWLMVYQFTGPAASANAPFPAPAMAGKGMYGNCVDERTDATWPFTPIAGATYLTLPKVNETGPGITGSLNVIETNPPNMVGNSTFRHYDFTYGGGAPGDVNGFNASMTTAAMSTEGMDYTLDIGKQGCKDAACTGPASATDTSMQYHMPDPYTTPLGIGGGATVMIPNGQDLEFTWTAPANDFGSDGKTHTKNTHFNFTFFADPNNATNPPQFICFPDVDGHQLIPAAVISALPAGGLIVNADLSHYLEAREANPGEMRRFDLVSISCHISLFMKQ